MTVRVLPALVTLAVVCAGCTSQAPPEGPALHLARGPYLGVACGTPSSTACDRLGIAVWLKEQVPAVTATVAGRQVELRAQEHSSEDERGWYLEGYLQPAGFRDPPFSLPERWIGVPQVSVPLEIETVPPSGGPEITVTVRLSSGWG